MFTYGFHENIAKTYFDNHEKVTLAPKRNHGRIKG